MSAKKSTLTRRKYDASFKEDVLTMISSGRSISDVSQALGVSASLIHRWNKSANAVSATSAKNTGALSVSHNNSIVEIERLKSELRRTEQERDILKKALGIFSRGI